MLQSLFGCAHCGFPWVCMIWLFLGSLYLYCYVVTLICVGLVCFGFSGCWVLVWVYLVC